MTEEKLILGICAAGVSVVLGAILTPLVRLLALRIGAVDEPSLRRVHRERVPRMGGLAIVFAFAVAFVACRKLGLLSFASHQEHRLVGFALASGIVFCIGLFDDVRGMRAWWKLGGQVFAAVIVWSAGVRVNPVLVIPGLGPTDLGIIFSFVATLGWILVITNAINLIDGLDGLAGGVVFFAAGTNVVVAFLTDNTMGIALNAALAGAVLGFLFYNFNPARIFMGDTGSLFLGFVLSSAALLTSRQKESTLASLLVPLIALGLPLTDTLLAMARRFVARRSIFAADREHLHHRLLDLGFTHRKAVLVLYSCSLALCAISVAAVFGQNWTVGGALLLALLMVVGIVRFAGSIQLAIRQRQERRHLFTPATLAVGRSIVEAKDDQEDSDTDLRERIAAALEPEHFPAIAYAASGSERVWWRPLGDESQSGRQEGRVRKCDLTIPSEEEGKTAVLEVYCAVDSRVPPQLEVLLHVLVDVLLSGTPSRTSKPPEHF